MFSFADYKEMIRIIKATGRQTDYHEALRKDRFILMRHDVEYSVERAHALAKVEYNMDFSAHYFFQWTNNTYNLLSRKNRDMIKDMRERGHHIGLHFALNGMTDMEQIKKAILMETELLGTMLGFPITEFSVHRPSKDVLRENIKIPGLINTYQEEFFTFAEQVTPQTPVAVKYLSDANHIWRYGYPDEETITSHDKIQILTHPFAWTKKGYDNFDNYKALVGEKYIELIESIDRECKDFSEYKDYFLERNLG